VIYKQNKQKEAFNKLPFFISYLITDPDEYGSTLESFSKNLTNTLQNNHIDMVCFRDKKTKNIKHLAKACLNISKEFGISKILINTDINLAIDLGFDGVHLTSNQFDKINLAKEHNLYTVISCHTETEIKMAKELKTNIATYSPIFYKENKGKPKGLHNLENIVTKYQDDNFSIIALGGIITKEHIEKIKQTNCKGFASIRYFNI